MRSGRIAKWGWSGCGLWEQIWLSTYKSLNTKDVYGNIILSLQGLQLQVNTKFGFNIIKVCKRDGALDCSPQNQAWSAIKTHFWSTKHNMKQCVSIFRGTS